MLQFYIGERDNLNPKTLEAQKKSLEGRKQIYIPELRICVFTKIHETKEETRKRYLSKTLKGYNK